MKHHASLFIALAAVAMTAIIAVLLPLNGPALVSAIATVALVAAFWDGADSPLDRVLRGFCASTAAGFGLWLAINSGWRAEPVGFTAAAALLIGVRLYWTLHSGKLTGPPARPGARPRAAAP